MTSSPTAIATPTACLSTSSSSTLVVIDPSVLDYQMLTSSVRSDVDVVVLEGDRNGVEQIIDILRQHSQVKNLHIVAHGAPGTIYIGNQPLSLDTLDHYAHSLQAWAVESIVIYGCQVAAGDAGAEFLHKLHHLTGAAIAASTTKIGSAALGGNWNLEVAIGNPQSSFAFDEATRQQYAGVLMLLNAGDYAALKALYLSTNGANWTNNTGWKDWDFNSTTPPDTSVVTSWKGVTLAGDRVSLLVLNANNLSGTIPTELGNLTNLATLALPTNQLTGTIPTELGNLTNLSLLNLARNQLTGTIPTWVTNLSRLQILNLRQNQLTGAIPSGLGSLTYLFLLALASNQLSGNIPSDLGNSNSLRELYLDTNALGGDVPQSILSKLNTQIIAYTLNNSPYINNVADQIINIDSSLTLNLSVSDIDNEGNDDVNNLTLSVASNNSNLIDSNGIFISGTGSDRTVTFTPIAGQLGTAIITMTLQDSGSEQTVKTFNLTVDRTLNADDYAALKALYQSTDGANWADNTGWKSWDFNSTTPPALSVVRQWKGVSLTGDRVTDLSLGNNNLVGSIPAEIGNFASLTNLNLVNNQLSGSIPTQIGNLINLTDLYLYGNQLSGSIPSQIGNLTKLSTLNLDVNKLSGSIPVELGNLTQLGIFSAYANQLSGTIPSQIGNLSNLGTLYLNYNQLSGSIPSELGNLSNLNSLDLSGNQLSGDIPQALLTQLGKSISNYNLDNAPFLTAIADQLLTENKSLTLNLSISDIDQGSNENPNNLTLTVTSNNSDVVDSSGILVSGTGSDRIITITPIAGRLGTATITVTLQDGGSEQTTKTFQLTVDKTLNADDYAALKALYQNTGGANWKNNSGWKDWDFSSNTPPILSVVSQWKGVSLTGNRVSDIDLSNNNLSGTIPSELGNLANLKTLVLRQNKLSGTISSALGQLGSLTYLNLRDNQLSGSIPSELGNLSSLQELYLYRNQLSGTIPSELANLNSLQTLSLQSNQLSGTIPVALSNLSNLTNLNLGGNQLSGSIPIALSNLSNLTSLILYNNQLSGSIPVELSKLSNLTALFLSSNQLSGSIPAELGNLAKLSYLILDHNQLSGSIPSTLGNLTQLINLSLENNQLSGSIPTDLGNLSNLKLLYLHTNQLSGTIPVELGNLNSLTQLFLNNNQLGGDVPQAIVNKLGTSITTYDLNNEPFISSIANQSTLQDQPLTLNLSISDIDAGSNDTNLSFSVTSNNPNLIDSNSISINGTGSDRTLTLTPISGKSGSATITMTLQDGSGEQTVKTFVLTVAPTLNAQDYAALKALYQSTGGANWTNNTGWKDWDFNSTTPPAVGLVITWKGVALTGDRVRSLNLENNNLKGTIPTELGDLSNLDLLNLSNNQLSGTVPSQLSNLNYLVQLYLNNNQLSGEVPQSLASQLNYLPPPLGIIEFNLDNAPFLSPVADQTTLINQPLTFNLPISDIDRGGNDTNLTLSVTSSNSTLIQDSGISVTGNGNARTLTLTPTTGQVGTATITIALQDQSGEQTVKTFKFTVKQTLNASDYAALKALYLNTGGANWTDKTGWKDWDFSSSTPPTVDVVSQWKGVELDGDRVTKLSLYTNNLKGNIPTELGNLSQLKHLNLSLNQLSGTIPSELSGLNQLTILFLNGNQLGGEIPATLLSKLENQITFYNLANVPYISSIDNQSIVQDQSLTLNLSISDIDRGSNDTNLSLSFSSNNTALIDTNNISVTGTGSDRTLTLAPKTGQSGTATITMTLQDGSGEQTVKTFSLTVDPLLNANDYAALKALYQNTDGAHWANNRGWKDWDFNSATPPDAKSVLKWYGVMINTSTGRVFQLRLNRNKLNGTIPSELGNLSKLSYLDLGSNQLNGTIPSELGNLSNLNYLGLNANQLSGTIPISLGSLSNLNVLNLGENQLSGAIPTELGNLSHLSFLNLGTNNLTGSIPSELGNLNYLLSLYLDTNSLGGDIPQSILSQLGNQIGDYNLSNAPFVTSIADQSIVQDQSLTLNVSVSDIDSGSNDTNLTLLAVSDNSTLINATTGISISGTGSDRTMTITPITGQSGTTTITMTLQDGSGEKTTKTFNLIVKPALNAQDYAALKALYQNTGGANWTDNTGWKDWDFNSTTPPALSIVSQWKGVSLTGDRVTTLDLYNNNLKGNLPTELGNLTSLTALRLYDNQLSGSIPSSLGNLSNLMFLNVANNQLSGSVPSELGNLSKLVRLNLFTNQLSGSIPSELGNLSKLSLFNLSYNQLSGSIPSELSNLTSLTQFYLNDNQLSGTVPQALLNQLGSLTNYDLGNAPFVTPIANQTTTSDKPLTLTLSVSDIDTTGNADPTVLTLKAVSNNSALIGESGISVLGTGGDRILTLTPTAGQTGTATIALTLQDDSGEKTEKTFTVTVNASPVITTPGTGTTTPTTPTPTTPTVTPISSITSLFDTTKGEFVVSDVLLSLNEETLPSGNLFRLRNGTPKADTLRGIAANEAMFGKAQNDQIKGQGGNDCLSGGKGNDLLDGGAGNDLIFGDAGNDTLVGGAGNDILIGGTGSDRIATGAGSDQVAFAKPIGGKNIDTITDFNAKTDHIIVLATGFGGGLVAGQALSATQFQIGTKAIGSDNRFIYNRKTGDLFFDADGSGAGKAIAFAHLKAGLNLNNQNIFVV
ncbi:MAG TPA: DUF4347 domain-containing protein [Crinalium sp.]